LLTLELLQHCFVNTPTLLLTLELLLQHCFVNTSTLLLTLELLLQHCFVNTSTLVLTLELPLQNCTFNFLALELLLHRGKLHLQLLGSIIAAIGINVLVIPTISPCLFVGKKGFCEFDCTPKLLFRFALLVNTAPKPGLDREWYNQHDYCNHGCKIELKS
jgi:hypothetical protein